MKRWYSASILGLALILGVTIAGMASAQEATRSVTIKRDGKFGGQSIPKGDYTVRFTEDKSGEVVFLKGKREVLKASYELTKLAAPASDTSVIFTLGADGSFEIKRIEFKGMSSALVLK